MLKFIAPLAVATAALVSTPAFAGDAAAPSIRVEYKDLDLGTEKGRKTLDRRIAAAARQLCPASVQTGTRIAKDNVCYDNAMKSVRDQLAAKGVGTGVTSASR